MNSKSAQDIPLSWINRPWIPQILLGLIAILLYFNTLGHEFTQDDAIVIYDNAYVKQGISGLEKIFSKDTFSGFFGEEGKGNLVSGGRYRPMTLGVFAVLWEFAGASPWVYHACAIMSYACVCIMLFVVIDRLTSYLDTRSRMFAFVATLIFVVHPIHTEVVANAKGLDEIWSLLWSLIALWLAKIYLDKASLAGLLGCSVSLFVALLSKENAIVWVLLIPLTLYVLGTMRHRVRIWTLVSMLVATMVIYLFIRGSIVGWSIGTPPQEMLNNPFIKVVDGKYIPFTTVEKVSSIVYGLGKYVQLLFVPHPLTHDYYPRHIGVMTWSDPAVIMAGLMHISMMLLAALGVFRRSILSYCIFFFYATIALTSNIIFPIGTHLSERFLFTPSISYGLLGGYAWWRLSALGRSWPMIGLGILCLLFSVKTVWRNQVWESDYRLFTTDVHTSGQSAKVRNAAGGAMIHKSTTETDQVAKDQLLQGAIHHLQEAIRIHPRYKNAHLLLGNAYTYLLDYPKAVISYENALRLDPSYTDAERNLLIVLIEGARQVGSKEQRYDQAIGYLNRAVELSPQDDKVYSLLGVAYGSKGDHQRAINYFQKSIQINPSIARTYVNLGYAQLSMGLEDDAQISFHRAVQLDPTALDHNE